MPALKHESPIPCATTTGSVALLDVMLDVMLAAAGARGCMMVEEANAAISAATASGSRSARATSSAKRGAIDESAVPGVANVVALAASEEISNEHASIASVQ